MNSVGRICLRKAIPLLLSIGLCVACSSVTVTQSPKSVASPTAYPAMALSSEAPVEPYPMTLPPLFTHVPQSYPNATSTSLSLTPEMTLDANIKLSDQYRLTNKDNGRIFTFNVTGRFLLFLDRNLYPENEQVCKPIGIVSWVTNGVGLYDEELKLFSVGFEGVRRGVCTIQIRDFKVIIQIIDLQ